MEIPLTEKFTSRNGITLTIPEIITTAVKKITEGKLKVKTYSENIRHAYGFALEIMDYIEKRVESELRTTYIPETPQMLPDAPKPIMAPEPIKQPETPIMVPNEQEDAIVAMFKSAPKASPITQTQLDKSILYFTSRITPKILDAANDYLNQLNSHLRKLTIKEIAAMALIHTTSVRDNEGDSPYNRISKTDLSEFDIGTLEHNHFRVCVMLLIGLDLTKVIGEKSKGQCRKYTVSSTLLELLSEH